MSDLKPVLDVEAVTSYLNEVYPQLNQQRDDYQVVAIGPGTCVVRLNAAHRHLRPGDTVDGPSLFTLADIGGYVLALSHVGRVALAVTTNLNINFMRKASAGAVDGHCRILKLGRSLMVFDAELRYGPDQVIVAHATGTYSIPQKR
jgi:uncharacterized protein (TIGR00369 family)